MELIKSFQVNHLTLKKGLYLSLKNDNILTIDLRIRTPYVDPLLTNPQIHSLEHCLATSLRNDDKNGNVIYVGPMGCRTGFYCIFKDLTEKEIALKLIKAFKDIAQGCFKEVPGNSKAACGNHLDLSLSEAESVAKEFYGVIKNKIVLDEYSNGESV